MKAIFTRMSDTIQNLDEVSLFKMPLNYTKNDVDDADVDILLIYRYDVPSRHEKLETINCSIK